MKFQKDNFNQIRINSFYQRFALFLNILGLSYLFLSSPLQAQIDTEFWFVAPDVDAAHGDAPIFLRISSFSKAAEVIISQPANPSFIPIRTSISANDTRSIDLTARKGLLENQPANSIRNYGLYIESDESVTVYYEVASDLNPEIYPLKGRNALGESFAIPSQDDYLNQEGNEVIDIVATENNTQVTITPTTALIGRAANVPFQVTLQKGQTFSARASGTSAIVSLKGSVIQSNKPVAVTISDDSIRTADGWDLIGDQMVPVNLTGKTYIAVQGFAGTADKVYILALENNTEIYINGNLVSTLSALQQYKTQVTAPSIFIESNKNIYVLHLSGHANESGSSLLPHIDCTGSSQMGFIRTSANDFALFLLTKKGNEGNFTVNGSTNLVTASDFINVPGSNGEWVAMRKEFGSGQIPVGQANLITNSTGLFHLGILNKLGGSSEYGYFSDFSSLNLGPNIRACEGEPLTLQAGAGANSYLWSDDSVEPSLLVNQSGEYWVKVTRGECILRDTIMIDFKPIPQPVFTNLIAQYCPSTDPVTLTASPSGGTFTINGITTNSLDPQLLGIGTFEVAYFYEDEFECQGFVSQRFEVVSPPVDLQLTNLEEGYCIDQGTFTVTGQPVGGFFRVNNQLTNQFNPSALGVGQHQIEYIFTDYLGCLHEIGRTIEVVGFANTVVPSGDSLFVCPPNETGVFLKASEARNYLWSTGDTTRSLEVRNPGIYEVIMDNGYGCETTHSFEVFGKCTPVFYLPEAFSPNRDGLNDVLEILGTDFNQLDLKIYNRWGEIVYVTFKQNEPWDGTLQGKEAPSGVYYWKASYKHPVYTDRVFYRQGKVSIVR